MDSGSANESFTISCTETLLENQPSSQPKHTRKFLSKKRVFFFILVVVLVISCSAIISYLCRTKKPEPNDLYLARSRRYFCHLTTYRGLCYKSMSSVLNATDLDAGPGPIFSVSIRVAMNQLTSTNDSITKALSSQPNNGSLAESRLRDCQAWVHDSLSRLNGSLTLIGIDSNIEWLTYAELDEIKASIVAARFSALNCFFALQEIEGVVVGEEKVGVDEVKSGVDKARKYMINSLGLFDGRESMFVDFYTPLSESDIEYYYNYYSYKFDPFDYRFLVCLYAALYLFLALLYFLFWRGD